MKSNIQAFTLIELLVVVLIIGMLVAVAIPQYKKAVLKSRLAAIKPILSAIKTAEESYYLANGEYTYNMDLLDIGSSCSREADVSLVRCDPYFLIDIMGDSGTNLNWRYIEAAYCLGKKVTWSECEPADFYYRRWYNYSTYPNKEECIGVTDIGKEMCKSIN
ncbi:prepilin-type N-terminal cleavage/methylation domain-containing protein [bacterium]|nr:prepilin-type N-terminal cleavage/methylation domain-containing protein [bacterium]MBR2081818.1 prepilin-type N-terminal cleavage/methylation domain-containing protein [Elusimicrobiaceae bacterium]